MASFTNAGAFASHVRQGASVMQRANRAATVRATMVAKEALLAAPGAPHRVAGRPTTVTSSVTGTGEHVMGTAKWTGPAHLVNNPTVPHTIEPKNAQALKFPDGNIRYAEFHGAPHPGTAGKHFYQTGRTAAQRIVPEVWRRTHRTALGGHFG